MKIFSWMAGAFFFGMFAAMFFWEADIMWFEQGFLFGFLAIMCVWGFAYTRKGLLHKLYLSDNPGIGLVRLAFWIAVAWCLFVLTFFGDPTIEGIWYAFYLVMAIAFIYIFGLKGAESFGLRLRVDVYERKNFAAAWFIAAFVLSTGLIAGGSMWGEAIPESYEYGAFFEALPSYEDGTWITPWFFLMGWLILYATMRLWFFREKTVSGKGIRQDRRLADGRAAALYCVGCAIPITDAVAGTYYGMADSFIGFAAIAFPVLAHETLRPSSHEQPRDPQEHWFYIVFGIAGMLLSPIISSLLGFR